MFIFGYLFIAIAKILSFAINLYIFVIIVNAMISWFSLSKKHEIITLINSMVEPVLEQIRKHLPAFSFDISPIIAILVLYFLDEFVVNVLKRLGQTLL